MEEETSDYNGSLKTEDLEQTNSKTLEDAFGSINPLFETNNYLDTNRESVTSVMNPAGENDENKLQRNRSDSEQAIESLSRLSDMLDREENGGSPNENSEGINPESGEIADSCKTIIGTTSVAHTSNGTADAFSGEMIEENGKEESTGLISSDNLIPIMVDGVTDENKTIDSPIKDRKEIEDAKQPQIGAEDEPNPDYDIKQVRFSGEVLDTDDNKFAPLKEEEKKRKVPKRIISQNQANGQNEIEIDVNTNDSEQSDIRDFGLEKVEPHKQEETDEPGWVEEEINIPNIVMTLEDNEPNESDLNTEVSTHF